MTGLMLCEGPPSVVVIALDLRSEDELKHTRQQVAGASYGDNSLHVKFLF